MKKHTSPLYEFCRWPSLKLLSISWQWCCTLRWLNSAETLLIFSASDMVPILPSLKAKLLIIYIMDTLMLGLLKVSTVLWSRCTRTHTHTHANTDANSLINYIMPHVLSSWRRPPHLHYVVWRRIRASRPLSHVEAPAWTHFMREASSSQISWANLKRRGDSVRVNPLWRFRQLQLDGFQSIRAFSTKFFPLNFSYRNWNKHVHLIYFLQ